MLQTDELAAKVSNRLVAIFAGLEDTIRLVEDEEPAEMQSYRLALAVCAERLF